MTVNKERGASLVEYALLVALIAVVAIVAVRESGKNARCEAYVATCGVTMRQWPGGISCNPVPWFGFGCGGNAQICLESVRNTCLAGGLP